MPSKPTVFIVDGNAQDRAAVCDLARQMDLPCTGYGLGKEFLKAYEHSWPGCLIMEVRIPDIGGLHIQCQLAREGATLPVIFLTAHANATTAVQAMRAGALQFFEKPLNEHDMWDAIQEAIALDQHLRKIRSEQEKQRELLDCLSVKERRILQLVLEGNSNKETAKTMEVCVRTVELRRASLMKKLGVQSWPDLLQLLGTGNLEEPPLNGFLQNVWRDVGSFGQDPGQVIHLVRRYNGRKPML